MAADAARRSAADIARTVEDAAEALVRGARLLGAPTTLSARPSNGR